ncbi:hypothetical protein ElyMa_000159000 [Elysia marginata]|uniref:Uncharacterized protein n=1 Tax=Elysia marginata TaxID=1093978 RepID=A0AAV4ERC5_9GAST|nr:hypothetical protein ElyMa_000159000 [Elysia marginata]
MALPVTKDGRRKKEEEGKGEDMEEKAERKNANDKKQKRNIVVVVVVVAAAVAEVVVGVVVVVVVVVVVAAVEVVVVVVVVVVVIVCSSGIGSYKQTCGSSGNIGFGSNRNKGGVGEGRIGAFVLLERCSVRIDQLCGTRDLDSTTNVTARSNQAWEEMRGGGGTVPRLTAASIFRCEAARALVVSESSRSALKREIATMDK